MKTYNQFISEAKEPKVSSYIIKFDDPYEGRTVFTVGPKRVTARFDKGTTPLSLSNYDHLVKDQKAINSGSGSKGAYIEKLLLGFLRTRNEQGSFEMAVNRTFKFKNMVVNKA